MTRIFREGDTVCLSRPTAGKLDPHWEGGWKFKQVMSPLTVEITNGQKNRYVHINRLHHRIQPNLESPVTEQTPSPTWQPPTVDHLVLPPAPRRYPLRHRVPPDRYGYQDFYKTSKKGGASVAEHKHSHPLLSKSMSVGHVMVLLYNH